MNKQNSSNTSSESQRATILAWLKIKTLTTQEARTELDIFHPASRILELRAQGYNIVTDWEVVNTSHYKHRIAKYVLFAGDTHA